MGVCMCMIVLSCIIIMNGYNCLCCALCRLYDWCRKCHMNSVM